MKKTNLRKLLAVALVLAQVLCLTAVFALGANAAEAQKLTYTLYNTNDAAMTLDGKVSAGESWDNVPWANLSYYDGNYATGKFSARFKAVWTETAIYVMVEVADPNMNSTGAGWADDVVRIWIGEDINTTRATDKGATAKSYDGYPMSGYMAASQAGSLKTNDGGAGISQYFVAKTEEVGYTIEYKYNFNPAAKNAVAGNEIYLEVQAVDYYNGSKVAEQHYWNSIFASGNALKADKNYTLAGRGILSAIPAGIEMQKGAAVRLATPTGLRFETRVNKALYDAWIAEGKEVKTGTLILPTDYLTDNNVAFTKAALDAASISYLDIENVGWANAATAEADGYYQYYGSIVNVKDYNYTRDFSAIAYITVGDVTIYSTYSADDHSRNIAAVAAEALADAEGGYTNDQKDILNGFIPAAPQA